MGVSTSLGMGSSEGFRGWMLECLIAEREEMAGMKMKFIIILILILLIIIITTLITMILKRYATEFNANV